MIKILFSRILRFQLKKIISNYLKKEHSQMIIKTIFNLMYKPKI